MVIFYGNEFIADELRKNIDEGYLDYSYGLSIVCSANEDVYSWDFIMIKDDNTEIELCSLTKELDSELFYIDSFTKVQEKSVVKRSFQEAVELCIEIVDEKMQLIRFLLKRGEFKTRIKK